MDLESLFCKQQNLLTEKSVNHRTSELQRLAVEKLITYFVIERDKCFQSAVNAFFDVNRKPLVMMSFDELKSFCECDFEILRFHSYNSLAEHLSQALEYAENNQNKQYMIAIVCLLWVFGECLLNEDCGALGEFLYYFHKEEE